MMTNMFTVRGLEREWIWNDELWGVVCVAHCRFFVWQFAILPASKNPKVVSKFALGRDKEFMMSCIGGFSSRACIQSVDEL